MSNNKIVYNDLDFKNISKIENVRLQTEEPESPKEGSVYSDNGNLKIYDGTKWTQTEIQSNRIDYLDSTCTEDQYLSAKALYNIIYRFSNYDYKTYINVMKHPYFCFISNQVGSSVKLNKPDGVDFSFEISEDDITWETYDFSSKTLNEDDKLYFRNASDEIATSFSTSDKYFYFTITGNITATGNVISLLDKTCKTKEVPDYCFYKLFTDCNGLTNIDNLFLHATKLGSYCYSNMFFKCENITKVPDDFLPATNLSAGCYSYMFVDCSAIKNIPENLLPATTLTENCYRQMFSGCSNLKISDTKDDTYYRSFRIPYSGTGTSADNALTDMFTSTGGTFTGTPDINTTYYMSE